MRLLFGPAGMHLVPGLGHLLSPLWCEISYHSFRFQRSYKILAIAVSFIMLSSLACCYNQCAFIIVSFVLMVSP